MALIKCPECKGKVSNTVETCPHCGFVLSKNGAQGEGAPSKNAWVPRTGKQWAGWAVIAALAVTIFMVDGQGGDIRSENSTASSNPDKKNLASESFMSENALAISKKLLEDDVSSFYEGKSSFIGDSLLRKSIKIKASEYASAYENNEIEADNRFKGKSIAVTGLVTGINKGFMDEVYLTFRGVNSFSDVTASYIASDSVKKELSTYSKGDVVKALCKGDGKAIISSAFDDCVPLSFAVSDYSNEIKTNIYKNNHLEDFVRLYNAEHGDNAESIAFMIAAFAVAISDKVDCLSRECSYKEINDSFNESGFGTEKFLSSAVSNMPFTPEQINALAKEKGYPEVL